MSSSIKEIWRKQANSSKNKVVKERITELKNLNCSIGTITFSKAKIFTIEIEQSVDAHSNYLRRFVGVEVQILPLGKTRKELTIILLEEELTDIFVLFIEDIINSLLLVENSEQALLIVSRRINYWKKLFGKFSGNLLTPQQQRGLFGELFFLKHLLESNSNYLRILEAWQAPSGTNQDFYFSGKAVEVKTSKSNTPTIKIANEFQLDISGLKQLYIAFFKLNEYPDHENTLFNIIVEIRNYLNTNPELLKSFNSKLESLGIISEFEEEYDKTGYVVISEKYYRITAEFPKITSSLVNDAISKISYEISPNECKKFEINFENIVKELFDEQ
ncbi:PD-(D/E)XK motif protein [Aquimarina algiphila]|uniref:PD-(D/E)XK motif protein n=1 Tax=Aquimarina algiphila TaxID=2047982 RepID=UPI00232E275F|nr:PD-(D/E)XK motif protein [Aquimarina algiphila]